MTKLIGFVKPIASIPFNVAGAGLVNALSILGGSLIPIPLVINFFGYDQYYDYLIFFAYVGVFGFANLMFPQRVADQVDIRGFLSSYFILSITIIHLVLLMFIAVFLNLLSKPSYVPIFLYALLFSFLRSSAFSISGTFSGAKIEWLDKAVFSVAQHLTPLLSVGLKQFFLPSGDLFLIFIIVSFLFLYLSFIVAVAKNFIRIGTKKVNFQNLVFDNIIFFIFLNITSIVWILYPLLVPILFDDFNLITFSLYFKVLSFVPSFLTPIFLLSG